ncbi:MAG: hypothetical protein NTY35_02030 [Planctomycetota bacterium]|nr:hypothetical protein [Planctomycetota bacterium]
MPSSTPIAVVGASGPTGVHLARLLVAESRTVRVVARDESRLRRIFAGLPVEVRALDVGTPHGAARRVPSKVAGSSSTASACLRRR